MPPRHLRFVSVALPAGGSIPRRLSKDKSLALQLDGGVISFVVESPGELEILSSQEALPARVVAAFSEEAKMCVRPEHIPDVALRPLRLAALLQQLFLALWADEYGKRPRALAAAAPPSSAPRSLPVGPLKTVAVLTLQLEAISLRAAAKAAASVLAVLRSPDASLSPGVDVEPPPAAGGEEPPLADPSKVLLEMEKKAKSAEAAARIAEATARGPLSLNSLPDAPTVAFLETARILSRPLLDLGVSLEELAFGGPISAPVAGWMGRPVRERLPGEPGGAGRPQAIVVRQALVGELFPFALVREAEAAGIVAFAPAGVDLARQLAGELP